MDPSGVGAVVVEYGLHARRGELVTQGRSLLPPELVVVGAAHLVRPAVALCLSEHHASVGEGLLVPSAVYRPRVHQSVGDLVPESLLEATNLKSLSAEVPVGLRCLRRGEHLTPFVAHELVVDLMQAVRPRRAALESLAGELVVVDDVDVVVQVPTRAVHMADDKVVGRVHPLGQ